MTIKELQEHYIEDLKLDEATINSRCINIPITISKYQNYYFSTLNKISDLYELREKTYNLILVQYKMGESELSNISLNSTELKRALESSLVYRELQLKISRLENELKLVEEMIKTIRDMGYSVKNYIDFMKLQNGII